VKLKLFQTFSRYCNLTNIELVHPW